MRPICKAALILEIVLCFGPAFIFLCQGFILVTVFSFLSYSEAKPDFLFIPSIMRVVGGVLGTIGVVVLLRKIINPNLKIMSSPKILFFMVCGVLSLTQPLFSGINAGLTWTWPAALIFVLPLIAAFHIIYLGRSFLFSSQIKRVA